MNATVSIETIDAKKASHYLAMLLEGQRNLREGHVLRLATEIEDGNWHLTSDALLFVKNKLANGQHRLHAVVLAEKPCPFLVLRTEDEEVYKVLDSGMGRTTGDALQFMGVNMSRDMASSTMLVLMYDRNALSAFGRNREASRITRSHVIDYIEEHQKALDKELAEISSLHSKKRILPVSAGAAILHLANRNGKGDAWTFARNLYLGGTDDATHDLRERLIRNASSRVKLNRFYIFALLIKTYKSFINGTRPGVLKMLEGEPFPKLP